MTVPSVEVVLVLVPTLRGRVVGERLSGFQVTLGREDARRTTTGRLALVSPDDGTFGISHLPDKPHWLLVRARRDERYALLRGVWPTSGPLTIPLEQGHTIAGEVVVPEPWAATGRVYATSAELGFRVVVWTVPGGGFRFDGLPPGRYELSFSSVERGVTVKPMRVEAGADALRLEASVARGDAGSTRDR